MRKARAAEAAASSRTLSSAARFEARDQAAVGARAKDGEEALGARASLAASTEPGQRLDGDRLALCAERAARKGLGVRGREGERAARVGADRGLGFEQQATLFGVGALFAVEGAGAVGAAELRSRSPWGLARAMGRLQALNWLQAMGRLQAPSRRRRMAPPRRRARMARRIWTLAQARARSPR